MRPDLEEAIQKLDFLLKHSLKSARVAILLFVLLLFFGAVNDFYLAASHQTIWYPWLSNIPLAIGIFWQGSVIWKNYRRWVLLNKARAHLYAAGDALTASGLDHHLEQADAALARAD